MSLLETTEVVLVHCNNVSNDYFYTFVLNKSFHQLLDVLPENFIFLTTFDSIVFV